MMLFIIKASYKEKNKSAMSTLIKRHRSAPYRAALTQRAKTLKGQTPKRLLPWRRRSKTRVSKQKRWGYRLRWNKILIAYTAVANCAVVARSSHLSGIHFSLLNMLEIPFVSQSTTNINSCLTRFDQHNISLFL